jgi:hypothetical protein
MWQKESAAAQTPNSRRADIREHTAESRDGGAEKREERKETDGKTASAMATAEYRV